MGRDPAAATIPASPDREEKLKAKILIVGGGAMGTCVALHAARRCDPLRDPVVLIERDQLGAGSSGRTGAVVHQAYADRAMAGMARDALKVYAGMQSTTGMSVGYQRTGVLVVAGSDAESAERLREAAEMQRDLGIDSRIVDASEMRGLCPGIDVPADAIGAYEAAGGFVDPKRTIHAFAKLARLRGAVTRVGVKDPTVLVENGRAVGVRTSEGVFHAPNVVLATGPWTPAILRELGAEVPLRVVRVDEHFLEMPDPPRLDDTDAEGMESDVETRFLPDPLDLMPAAHPVLFDTELGFHARCEPIQRRTRIGKIGFDDAVELDAPEEITDEVAPDFVTWARETVARRMPVYAEREDRGSAWAWMTLTPDRRPVAGPVDGVPGLYVVTGFSGNDFQLAPSIGEGIAQMIVGEPVSAMDAKFLSPNRFESVA